MALQQRGRNVVISSRFHSIYQRAGFCHRLLLSLCFVGALLPATAYGSEPVAEGVSTREARQHAIRAIPFHKLNANTAKLLRDVLDNPSFYRRMPSQTIQCDPELFAFLVRKPEVMVNTWDLMGITKVTAKRTSQYSFFANDGVGTRCKCDLVYGDDNLHIYYGTGDYDGSMSPRTIKGRAVCILRSEKQALDESGGSSMISGTMDVFLKLDNLGADLLTRTFGPLVAKTADHNFVETAQFVSQLSQVCANNPTAALGLASQLGNIEETVRQEFVTIAARIAEGNQAASSARAQPAAANDQALQEIKLATLPSPGTISKSSRQQQATKATAEAALNKLAISANEIQTGGAPIVTADTLTELPGSKPTLERALPPSSIQPRKTKPTMRR
jgi:hypothetical protein